MTLLPDIFDSNATTREGGLLIDTLLPNEAMAEQEKAIQFSEDHPRAPKGGVHLQGTPYVGGQFIPKEVMAALTDDEKASLTEPTEPKAQNDAPAPQETPSERPEDAQYDLTYPVPKAAGEAPVPEGHIRAYHYSNFNMKPDDKIADVIDQRIASLREHGIDLSKAIGSTYGEPDVVWASTEKPHDGKVYVEFSISPDDERWPTMFKPDLSRRTVEDWEAQRNNFYFYGTIKPEEFIAIHQPWHGRYRYLLDNPSVGEAALRGEHDDLLDDAEYGPAIKRFKKDHADGK
jgi:hypothetical protein